MAAIFATGSGSPFGSSFLRMRSTVDGLMRNKALATAVRKVTTLRETSRKLSSNLNHRAGFLSCNLLGWWVSFRFFVESIENHRFDLFASGACTQRVAHVCLGWIKQTRFDGTVRRQPEPVARGAEAVGHRSDEAYSS